MEIETGRRAFLGCVLWLLFFATLLPSFEARTLTQKLTLVIYPTLLVIFSFFLLFR